MIPVLSNIYTKTFDQGIKRFTDSYTDDITFNGQKYELNEDVLHRIFTGDVYQYHLRNNECQRVKNIDELKTEIDSWISHLEWRIKSDKGNINNIRSDIEKLKLQKENPDLCRIF